MLTRRNAIVLMVGVLLIITLVAVQRTLWAWAEHAEEDAEREQARLAGWTHDQETALLEQVGRWFHDLREADETALASWETDTRTLDPRFDALYLWERRGNETSFLHPPMLSSTLRADSFQTPCLRRAMQLGSKDGPMAAVAALGSCRTANAGVRALATTMAGEMLLKADEPAAAWRVLGGALRPSDPVSDPHLPLHLASRAGLDPRWTIHRRRLLAQALGAAEETERQCAVLIRVVDDIAQLSGAVLEDLLPIGRQILQEELTASCTDTATLAASIDRAQRRLSGFVQVRERLGPTLRPADFPPADPDRPWTRRLKVVHDMYEDAGFLLVYGFLDGGTRMAAIQLDVAQIIGSLAEAGADRGYHVGEPPVELATVTAAFHQLFPHLEAWAERPIHDAHDSHRLGALLAPILLAFLLGTLAIVAFVRADHRQRELLERQAAFVARVTHELKTPLAGIRVMAEALEMDGDLPASKRQAFTGRILAETDRLTQRVDEVLRMARTPQIGAVSSVDPSLLAQEALDTWAPRFAAEGGTLTLTLEAAPCVLADEPLLVDALNNLLDNALKYRHPDRAPVVTLTVTSDARGAELRVADNGLGVPPNLRKSIFERFTRVEGPGRGPAGGHGLGLAFVAETMRVHGGSAECREGVDGGALFMLKIPRAGSARGAHSPQSES